MRNARGAGLALVLAVALPAGNAAGSDEEVDISVRARLGAEAGYSGPLGLAGTGELLFGLGADVREDDEQVRAMVGLLAQVHAGTAGWTGSLGVGARARIREDDFKGSGGAGLKLSLARTWSSRGSDRGVTYLGPELDLSAMRVAVTLGPLFRVGGGRGGSVLFSWGVGVRL